MKYYLSEISTNSATYKVEKVLSAARLGHVLSVINTTTQSRHALKHIQLSKREPTCRENPYIEHDILTKNVKSQCRNLMYITDSMVNEKEMILVMPLYQCGDMLEYILSNGAQSSSFGANFLNQMVRGLSSLHQRGIAHCDMSLENVLYDEGKNQFIIMDFGASVINPSMTNSGTVSPTQSYYSSTGTSSIPSVSRSSSSSATTESSFMIPAKGYYGKPYYVAPEVVISSPHELWNPCASDIWSLGTMLFIVLTGMPFVGKAHRSDRVYYLLSNGNSWSEIICHMGIENKLCPLASNLLSQMLLPQPSERLTLQEILDHPYLTNNFTYDFDHLSIHQPEINQSA